MISVLIPVKGIKDVAEAVNYVARQAVGCEIVVIRNGLSQNEVVACCKVAPNVKHLWLKEANKAKDLNLG